MSDADREWVGAETHRRFLVWTPIWDIQPTEVQIAEAVDLAIDLYEVAASYGINKAKIDVVTSFIDVAIDAIRARDRRW